MLNDPFMRLIVYLLFVGGIVWLFRWVLTEMRVPDPPAWVATLVVGIILLLLAFQLSGVGAML